MIRKGSRDGHQKTMKEIELRAHNLSTILGSIEDIIGGDLDDRLMRKRFFTFIINKHELQIL